MTRRLSEWHLSVYGYRCGDRAGGDCAFLFTPPNSLSPSPSLSFAGTLRDVLSGRGPSLGQHHDSPLLSMLYDNNSVTFNYIKRLYMLFY